MLLTLKTHIAVCQQQTDLLDSSIFIDSRNSFLQLDLGRFSGYCNFISLCALFCISNILYPILFISKSLYLCAISKHLLAFNKRYSNVSFYDENPHLPSFHPKLHCSQNKKPLKWNTYMHNVYFPGYGVDWKWYTDMKPAFLLTQETTQLEWDCCSCYNSVRHSMHTVLWKCKPPSATCSPP